MRAPVLKMYFFSIRTRRRTMKNNLRFDAGRVFSMKITWAVLLIAVLFLSGGALAAEKKSGRNLILTLKNGSVVKGELLTVERDRLILFDSIALTDADVRIGDIAQIEQPRTYVRGILKGKLRLS
jgi:hypothetical protein